MASKDATIYICDRCGKEVVKDWDADVPENWIAVTISKVNDYDWCEDDPVELCDECANEFNSLWDKFKGWDWSTAKEIKMEETQ